MKHRSTSYWVRRSHRYLGLFIGIQFLFWTLGGLYFSWTGKGTIRSAELRRPAPRLSAPAALASPALALDAIRAAEPIDSLAALELVPVLGQPTYRVAYFTRAPGQGAVRRVRLADARTARLRPALSRDEAVRVARAEMPGPLSVRGIRYLTEADVNGQHEYRSQPLPAWAITFDLPSRPTAYVAAEMGTLVNVRNQRWRIYDFLWMLHTMDYRGRDDINNLILRVFSILGLITIASGFVLFWFTSRPYLDRAHRAARRAPPVRQPPPEHVGSA